MEAPVVGLRAPALTALPGLRNEDRLPCIGTVGARGLHRILAPAVQCVYKCCMPCLFSYLLLYLINRYLALNDAFLSKNCDLAEIVPILCKRPPQSATESLQSGAEEPTLGL